MDIRLPGMDGIDGPGSPAGGRADATHPGGRGYRVGDAGVERDRFDRRRVRRLIEKPIDVARSAAQVQAYLDTARRR